MHNRAQPSRIAARLLAGFAASLIVLATAAPVVAQSPSPPTSPQPSPVYSADLIIEATPLLQGHVRPGAWAAVNVQVTNNGPAVSGELRIRGPVQTQSRYGVEAELPTGAKQQFTLYAQTAVFGSRVNVELVNGDQVLQAQQVRLNSHDAYSPTAAVIAERPEGLLDAVTDAMRNVNEGISPVVIRLGVPDLPARVEAWAALDRLVWQDTDASQLSVEQIEALRLWVGAGGQLVVVGGTTDPGFVSAFNRDDVQLLPFSPSTTVEVQSADLAALLGSVPATATPIPALAGTLDRGSVLARSGDSVVAASAGYGRGSVSLVGFDPSAEWISGSDAAEVLWHRLLPQGVGPAGPALNPLNIIDDSQIVSALQNLPSIDLPPIEQLFVLLLAYVALIGPINYLILRRLDKREWAWVTIPALVVVFAFGSYGLGATLKGSDVIVNQITVVRAAQGTGRGIGQAYIGIYSPTRRTFDVRVPGGALLSNPTSLAQFGQSETPLDVVFGDSNSRLRDFEVGFGVLRGFRAEAPADAPAVDADLRLSAGRLTGTITNRSDTVLGNVAVVFSGGVQSVPVLQPAETKNVTVDVTSNSFFGYGMSERIFGATFPRDPAGARTVTTRRAVIDQLFPWGSQGSNSSPLLLAWRKGPVLDVDLPGDTPNAVGEGLFMIPLGMTLDARQVFGDQMMTRTVIENTSNDGWADINGMYLSRGALTVETRPARFDGSFHPTSLEIAITQGDVRLLNGEGELIEPLPADQQPPQDDPLAEPGQTAPPSAEPEPGAGGGGGKPFAPGAAREAVPDFQLFDRTTGSWVEFAHPRPQRAYLIANPERYVDEGGAVLFRFVNRSEAGQFGEEQLYFQLMMRLEGSIG